MYSAKTEAERKRFARMYLSTHNPKAQAERKSAIAMYEVARDIIANELTQSLASVPSTTMALFVNANCIDCANGSEVDCANRTSKGRYIRDRSQS